MNLGFWEIMNHGGGSMWVILVFSIIVLGVAIERLIAQWHFAKKAQDLASAVNKALQASNDEAAIIASRSLCERSQSPVGDVFLAGLSASSNWKPERVNAVVHRERLRMNGKLRGSLWMLGTIGATAPFVGLFGTVVGIMKAMSTFDGDEAVSFARVSGPISEALVVTAAGILVAVESVIFFNYFSQRASKLAGETKLVTDEFLENLNETLGNYPASDRPATRLMKESTK